MLLLVINALQAWQRAQGRGAMHDRPYQRPRSAPPKRPGCARTLIALALAFLLLFLVLPLAAVFTEALRKGWGAYLDGAARSPMPGRPSA